MDAISEVELGQHALDVRLDGGLAEDERRGDLCVGEAAADEREDLELAEGERRELVGDASCGT